MNARSTGATVALEVNGVPLEVDTRFRWTRGKLACLALALVLAVVAIPLMANANPIDDILNDWSQGCINTIAQSISEIGKSVEMTNNFAHLISSEGGLPNAMYTASIRFAKNVVWSSAVAMLSLSFLLQLMKVAQRIDGNAAMPALKEVLMLAVTFTICVWVLGHSFFLARDFYDLVNSWARGIQADAMPSTVTVVTTGADAADWWSLFWPNLFAGIAGTLGAVVVQVMFTARALQIYLYAAFAPLMLSMFMVDELRPWAMGFTRGFLACCLSGVVMVFATSAFPALLSSFLGGSAVTANDVMTITVDLSGGGDCLTGILVSILAVCGLCLKSGSFAREILGG